MNGRIAVRFSDPRRFTTMSNESTPPPDDDYISLQQACAIFDVSRGTLWTWTRTRGLPKYRLGQKTYFRRAEIRKLIQEGLVK